MESIEQPYGELLDPDQHEHADQRREVEWAERRHEPPEEPQVRLADVLEKPLDRVERVGQADPGGQDVPEDDERVVAVLVEDVPVEPDEPLPFRIALIRVWTAASICCAAAQRERSRPCSAPARPAGSVATLGGRWDGRFRARAEARWGGQPYRPSAGPGSAERRARPSAELGVLGLVDQFWG